MQEMLYHSVLRVAMAVVATVLVFDSGLFSPVTKQLSLNTQQYLGQAVGVYAGVESTELNTITAALTEKEQSLAEREKTIEQREIEVGLATGSTRGVDSTFILSVLLSIILVLIIINYILDFRRGRLLTKELAV